MGSVADLVYVDAPHPYEATDSTRAELAEIMDEVKLAIDGISLTIAELLESSVVFWIIPHTMEMTNLQQAEQGKTVNLEADVIAKHVAKLVESRN